MVERKKMLPCLAVAIAVLIAVYYGMIQIEGNLLQEPKIFGYVDMISKMNTNILYKLSWIIGDYTEAFAYKSFLASLGLLTGGILAHYICRKKPEIKIYPISIGLGVFPWILVGATVGLSVSTLLYGNDIIQMGWIPTFLPGCTIPAAIIVTYGGGWKTSLSGGILSGFIQYPFALAAVKISSQLGIPAFTFVTIFAMSIAGIIIIEIFRLLPWNKGLVRGTEAPKMNPYENKDLVLPQPTLGWMLRRSVTDLTELCFFGSEVAAIFLLLGAFISWFLNPASIGYGVPNMFPALLTTQMLTGIISAFVFYDKWVSRGFYCSFAAVIGASVCVMQYGPTIKVMVASVLLNIIITAPFTSWGFGYMLKNVKRYPIIIGSATCMGISIGIIAVIIIMLLKSGILV